MWGFSMKKQILGVLIALAMVVPVQSMDHSVPETTADAAPPITTQTAAEQSTSSENDAVNPAIESALSSDHFLPIIAWCSPAVRNLLMKTSKRFYRLACPANIAKLAIKGTAQLSSLDSAVCALKSKELFSYSMTQDALAQCTNGS